MLHDVRTLATADLDLVVDLLLWVLVIKEETFNLNSPKAKYLYHSVTPLYSNLIRLSVDGRVQSATIVKDATVTSCKGRPR